MTKGQVILLVVLVFAFVVMGMLLSHDAERAARTFSSDTPFLARSGTTRQDARAIVRDRTPALPPAPPASGEAPDAASATLDPGLPVSAVAMAPSGRIHLPVIDALLAGPPPEQALPLALEHLALAQGPETSEWNRAVGVLHARTGPEGLTAALEAFETAKGEAVAEDQRLLADLEAVRALHAHGQTGEALRRAEAALEEAASPTEAGLTIALTRADVLAASGAHGEAEEAYRETMMLARDAREELGETALGTYRLAAARLAQMLRTQQRFEEAAAVVEEVKRRLEYQ